MTNEDKPEKCPDCGAGFTRRPYSRNGWHYGDCDRRFHHQHGWEPAQPRTCLARQVAALREQLAEKDAKIAELEAKLNPPFLHRPQCEEPVMDVTCLNCQQIDFEEWYAENKVLEAKIAELEAIVLDERSPYCIREAAEAAKEQEGGY